MSVTFSAEERAELRHMFALGFDDQIRDQRWPRSVSKIAEAKRAALLAFDEVLNAFGQWQEAEVYELLERRS